MGRGGGLPMPGFFGPFLYQVIVPKMAICYSNFTIIFFSSFCHDYHQNGHHYHHNHHCNQHYHYRNFFGHTRKTLFWHPKKEDQVARMGGMGGDSMLERKRSFSMDVFPFGKPSLDKNGWNFGEVSEEGEGDNFALRKFIMLKIKAIKRIMAGCFLSWEISPSVQIVPPNSGQPLCLAFLLLAHILIPPACPHPSATSTIRSSRQGTLALTAAVHKRRRR